MNIITKECTKTKYSSKVFDSYFNGLSFGVLDIETTGLSPARNQIVLVGILLEEKGRFVQKQFFAENLSEEKAVLEEVLKCLDSLDVVLTYNGIRFDLPFIKTRSQGLGLPLSFDTYNLDLYKVIRGHSALSKVLPNLKQKTIESFMGLWSKREDTIDGGESVDLYYDFLETHNLKSREKVLLHNFDDVSILYDLLNILSKVDLDKAMFKMGFPIKSKGHLYHIDNISIKKGSITITGQQPVSSSAQTAALHFPDYENPLSFEFSKENGSFSILAKDILWEGSALEDLNYSQINQLATFLLKEAINKI